MAPSLAKRLLSPNDPLPLLLSSPNAHPELTPELYDFIALALRAYVSPWWSRISRYDKDFVPHITRIIVHVVGVIDARIQNLDINALVFHDVPVILTQHIRDYRTAQAKVATSYAAGGSLSLPALFAHLQPHTAVLSDGSIDADYYRQVIDVVLRVCMPPEEYEPEVERDIVAEVILKVLVNDIIPKLSQPWFIHQSILSLLPPTEYEVGHSLYNWPYLTFLQITPPLQGTRFSFQTAIVVVLSALQSFSATCLALIHAYKSTISTIKLVHQSPKPTPAEPISVVSSKSTRPGSIASGSTFSETITPTPLTPLTTHYAHHPIIFIHKLISASSRFTASILLTLLSMLTTAFAPFLDKLLPHLLSSFLSPLSVLHVTRTAKNTMFPNGYPGPPPIEPTPEEQAALRESLAHWKPRGPLGTLWPVFLGPDPPVTMAQAIEPLDDAQCNTRLIIFLLDRLMSVLFPELLGESVL